MSANPIAPNVEFARKLIEHCCWEDERVWKLAIVPLSDAQFTREVGFGLGSIQLECARIMNTEQICLARIRGEPPPPRKSQLDRRELRDQWREIHAAWSDFAEALDADLLLSDCMTADGRGAVTLKVWQLIFNVVYQGTAHRSDIMRMVAEVHEPPAFDLSLMQFLSGVFRQ
ncbi:MAG: DinB family protein [Chloroflexota bacterium]|nr:DinB family protein [Chloroflexota bacterium]